MKQSSPVALSSEDWTVTVKDLSICPVASRQALVESPSPTAWSVSTNLTVNSAENQRRIHTVNCPVWWASVKKL